MELDAVRELILAEEGEADAVRLLVLAGCRRLRVTRFAQAVEADDDRLRRRLRGESEDGEWTE